MHVHILNFLLAPVFSYYYACAINRWPLWLEIHGLVTPQRSGNLQSNLLEIVFGLEDCILMRSNGPVGWQEMKYGFMRLLGHGHEAAIVLHQSQLVSIRFYFRVGF